MTNSKIRKILQHTYQLGTAVSTLFILTTFVSPVTAQSLSPDKPAPLHSGVNSSVADSFVGPHFYYFLAGPGKVDVHIKFTSMGLLGNANRATIGIDLYDERQTWKIHKDLTSNGTTAQLTFPGDLKQKTKVIMRIQPPPQGLVRTGGNYEVQLLGTVQYDSNTASGQQDQIVKTYQIMSCIQNVYECGVAKFYPDGTFKISDGHTGTWKLFDSEANIYVLNISGHNLSVKLMPGRGLVEPNDVNSILFQEVR
ncbi:MAG: hypothetical protein V7L22_08135 [Nostoc sp.]|uniref:hypothetical protein n=1 Tax=Nostoc sp. TaxID=1180 RepID=UPI002FFA2765